MSPAPPRVVASIVSDLARVVARLHAEGTVHGALAPDRIVIGADGACSLAPGEGSIALARVHAAPERERSLLPAGDVWSLGAIAHALVTGERVQGISLPPVSEL